MSKRNGRVVSESEIGSLEAALLALLILVSMAILFAAHHPWR